MSPEKGPIYSEVHQSILGAYVSFQGGSFSFNLEDRIISNFQIHLNFRGQNPCDAGASWWAQLFGDVLWKPGGFMQLADWPKDFRNLMWLKRLDGDFPGREADMTEITLVILYS